uniref:Uncharacterized protein n=1 Tax=Avena sativa TaxID=4498 RepID=A0ACD5ZES7_AVESA
MPPTDIVVPDVETQVKPVDCKLSRKDMRLLRYGNLCNNFAKLVVGLASSEKTVEIAEKHMKEMEKEMAELKRNAAEAAKRKKRSKAIASPDTETVEENRNSAHDEIARDPPVVITKGRPSFKRKNSGLQLKKPRPTKCSACNKTDHDARNCPIRMANPEKFPLLGLFQ